MPASTAAKVKTTLQLVAIAMYILPLDSSLGGLKLGVLVVAVGLTVATGIAYVMQALRRQAEPPVQ